MTTSYTFTEAGIYEHSQIDMYPGNHEYQISFDPTLAGLYVDYYGFKIHRQPFETFRYYQTWVRITQNISGSTDLNGNSVDANYNCQNSDISEIDVSGLTILNAGGTINLYDGTTLGSGSCKWIQFGIRVHVYLPPRKKYLMFPRWQKTKYGLRPFY